MIARALALLAALVLLCGATVDPNDPLKSATIDERIGAQVPLDAPFVAANGNATTLRRIASGRPLLLTPVLHECPNICGVTLAGLGQAIAGQTRFAPGKDFAVVAFGIDPREGPAQARDDLQRLGQQTAAFTPAALTGSEAAIHAVTDALGYRYAWDDRIKQYAHVSATAVLTPDGRLSGWLYGIAPSPGELTMAVDNARNGRTGSVMEQLLLLCYHFDPQTGTWSLAITKVVRLAGIATVLALIALVVVLAKRRRRAEA
jgi:protein SCO1/2